jgi:hypothetical protein
MRPLLAALLQLGLVARLASSAAVVDPTTLRGKVRPPPWLAFLPCFDLCCRAAKARTVCCLSDCRPPCTDCRPAPGAVRLPGLVRQPTKWQPGRRRWRQLGTLVRWLRKPRRAERYQRSPGRVPRHVRVPGCGDGAQRLHEPQRWQRRSALLGIRTRDAGGPLPMVS